jgi:hypothetical protein
MIYVLSIVLLIVIWTGIFLFLNCRSSKNARPRPWLVEEMARLIKENEDLRQDVQRWRLRALRRGWKPGQFWRNG